MYLFKDLIKNPIINKLQNILKNNNDSTDSTIYIYSYLTSVEGIKRILNGLKG